MSGELKLYVWAGFMTDYTEGLAFAIAESELQARQLVADRRGWYPEDDEYWGTLHVLPLTQPVAFVVSGGG